MGDGEINIDFSVDSSGDLKLHIQCPRCQRVHSYPANSLAKGKEIHCTCGAILEIADEDLAELAGLFKPH